MKKNIFLLSLTCFLIIATQISCSSVSGRVIDAETGEGIKNAIVYAEWMINQGTLGHSSYKTYKVVEKFTDDHGKFYIPGVLNPIVGKPVILIYKRGYIARNNESYDFPLFKQKSPWNKLIKLNKLVLQYPILEPLDVNTLPLSSIVRRTTKYYKWDGQSFFDPAYTHYNHMKYIDNYIWRSGDKIKKIIEWEEKKANDDLNSLILVDIDCFILDFATQLPINNALVTIAGMGTGYWMGEKWESHSKEDGSVKFYAIAPILARPPFITINKNGYDELRVPFRSIKKREVGVLKGQIVFELRKPEKKQTLD